MLGRIYKTLITKVNEGSQCVMLTYLDLSDDKDGYISNKVILTEEDIENKSDEIGNIIYEKAHLSLETGKPELFKTEKKKAVLIEPFIPKPRLIVFGGGHISKALTEFASRTGFAVTVIDDRPFFANAQRFPEAEKVICESFEKSFDLINLRKSDYVVIITRGHRYDGIVLRKVLKYELSYAGMIGSKRRVKCMMEKLLDEGYTKDKLDLVNSPIGLDIGAVTPDEIAISIVSQLILYKNKYNNKLSKNFTFPELDMEVADKISEESDMPKALITILSSKGSVPRKAGAKMISYYDGRTIGSIGGGCSEAGVIKSSRGIIKDKGFLIEHVDLTGDAAEDEGMACGGIMDVLIEVF